jgi:predicted methyltransferase
MIDKRLTTLLGACAIALAACGQSAPEAPAETAAPAAEAASEPASEPAESAGFDLAAALEARSEEDRARDAGRKPVEILTLMGVEPGMDVLDLMAAGGWYSEVLSIAVGPEGSVTAQNPPFLLAFRDGYYDKALKERIGDRLTNVTKQDSSWEELAASGAQYDYAMSALNIHDVYYMQSPEAAAEFATAVYSVLKPGGVFAVIEHVGNPGAETDELHRLDPAIAIDIVTGAGFVLEEESDLLANPDDDHTQNVFSEGIRGNTDRFVLKFRKPAA